jgi:hypothetical protein
LHTRLRMLHHHLRVLIGGRWVHLCGGVEILCACVCV